MTRVFLAAGVAALAITAPATAGPHGGPGRPTRRPYSASKAVAASAPRNAGAASAASAGGASPNGRSAHGARPAHGARRAWSARQRCGDRTSAARRAPADAAQRQQARAERLDRLTMQRQHASSVSRLGAQPPQARVERSRSGQRRAVERSDRQQVRANRVQPAQNVRPSASSFALTASRRRCSVSSSSVRQLRRRALAGPAPAAPRRACPASRRTMSRGSRRSPPTAPRSVRADQLRHARDSGVTPPDVCSVFRWPRPTTFAALSPLPRPCSISIRTRRTIITATATATCTRSTAASNLIAALLPLLAGGYMPGSYLPSSYMSSYVPDYYGLQQLLSVELRRRLRLRLRQPVQPLRQRRDLSGRLLHRHGRGCDPDLRRRLWRRADAAVRLQLLQRAVPVPQHVL